MEAKDGGMVGFWTFTPEGKGGDGGTSSPGMGFSTSEPPLGKANGVLRFLQCHWGQRTLRGLRCFTVLFWRKPRRTIDHGSFEDSKSGPEEERGWLRRILEDHPWNDGAGPNPKQTCRAFQSEASTFTMPRFEAWFETEGDDLSLSRFVPPPSRPLQPRFCKSNRACRPQEGTRRIFPCEEDGERSPVPEGRGGFPPKSGPKPLRDLPGFPSSPTSRGFSLPQFVSWTLLFETPYSQAISQKLEGSANVDVACRTDKNFLDPKFK
ncbi:hypothetical protein GWK47_019637 [Chionoecetes opilio]|uniref:Uncharacterized protein n=1 Tax=Chionoecetes opilio TaxID=41210 RepID=A0A8J5CL68_CHIOP|nr:hypothetical protein GWK47_019637 [Chionoecetes opilio]